MVKNSPAMQEKQETVGSVSGLGRAPGGILATHSSILAWRISWTEELGRLQSMGSHRVGLTHTHTRLPKPSYIIHAPKLL